MKRANGDGSIRKRKNGLWEGRVTVNGKSKSLYGKHRAEVKARMEEILGDIRRDEYVEETDMTLSEWCDVWERDFLFSLSPNTRVKYDRDMRSYILPTIGNVKLPCLKPKMLMMLYGQLARRGLSEKSIKNIHGTLHTALEAAVNMEILKRNVSERARPPKLNKPKQEMHPLKDGQISEFLRCAKGNPYEHLYFVAIFTGMRQGELIGLTWDCIDFEQKTMHIYRQFYRNEETREFGFYPLKDKEARTFRAPDSVMECLQKIKRWQAEQKLRLGRRWHNDGFVFCQDDGHYVYARTVYKNFKRIVKAMGLPQVRFHDLRHTYATLAIQSGADIKTVSHNLGHATAAFTLDMYGHVTPSMMEDCANKIQAVSENIRNFS